MKRFLFLLLFAFLFITGCNMYSADDIDSFPSTDYSFMIKDNSYDIPAGTNALQLFNCFYSEFGYGEYNIQGQYTKTATAVLNGKTYTDTINKTLTKIKIWHVRDVDNKEDPISSFYVAFYTDNNEVLQYCYQWQYDNQNAWKNDITKGKIVITK